MTAARTHPGEDAWIDLAQGLTPPEEAQDLHAHLAGCADCERLFQQQVGMRERLRARNPFRPVRPPRRVSLLVAAVAALLLVPLGLRLLANRGSPRPDARFALPIELVAATSRSGTDAANTAALAEALGAYGRGELAECESRLSAARWEGALEDLRRLYLASCLAMQARYPPALELLDELEIATMPHPWREHAWSLQAQLLRELGRPDEARSIEAGATVDGPPAEAR